MKAKYALSVLFLFFACRLAAQQIPQFSQYMFNPLVLNPAYAGSREVINTVLLYRNQWVNMDGAPTTLTASINSPLKNKKIGIGLHVVSDKIGPSNNTQYVGSFAYRIRIGNGKLAFGLRAGIYDFRYDWDKVDYKDKADVFNTQQQTRSIKPGFDFGMYYYNTSFYAGLSLTQLSLKSNSATTSISQFQNQLAPHLIGTLGKAFELNKSVTLRPSAVVRYTENAPLSADANFAVLLDEKIWVGMGVRSNQELIFNVEYAISKLMRIGYSYDVASQKLRTASKGSHEIFLGFDIDFFKSRTISPRIFKYN
jgi:type IX secretion system PorP/SprF family membrane protein